MYTRVLFLTLFTQSVSFTQIDTGLISQRSHFPTRNYRAQTFQVKEEDLF